MSALSSKNTRRVALSGLLTSVMLVLGFIESLFPIAVGIPGVKLGLSNSVLIFALYLLGVPNAFVLMALKVLLSGALFAGVNTMMYSFAGGILSMAVMSLLHLIKGVSPIGVGAAGAVAHNVGQVALAMIVLQTDRLLYYMAILMLVGLATGVATGTVAKLLMERLPPSLRPRNRDQNHS